MMSQQSHLVASDRPHYLGLYSIAHNISEITSVTGFLMIRILSIGYWLQKSVPASGLRLSFDFYVAINQKASNLKVDGLQSQLANVSRIRTSA